MYGILADIVVVIHLSWTLFLIFGAWWGRKNRRVMMIHGAGLVFAVVSQMAHWYCPLTYLETWLEEQGGMSPAYRESFISYYAKKLIYIDIPQGVIFLLTIALVAVSLWLYRKAWRKGGSAPAGRNK